MTKLWLKVTQDEYQLPLAVADTASELAIICGTTSNSIRSTVSHYNKGRITLPSFICVELEGYEE